MYLDIEGLAQQCYEWQRSNMSVRCWSKELKEELYNIGLTFVWRKQQESNLKEVKKIVKDRCNDIDRQNIVAKMSEKISLTLYWETNFHWAKRLYVQCCIRKERSGIAWFLAGVWKFKRK
jgi:hypothetical protein